MKTDWFTLSPTYAVALRSDFILITSVLRYMERRRRGRSVPSLHVPVLRKADGSKQWWS